MTTMTPTRIYLDNAATTPTDLAVAEAMYSCMLECSANPSAAYTEAGLARRVIREAKSTLGKLLGATAQEIFFTSGGTESNNWALRQAAGRHVVLSAVEHKSVSLAAQNWQCSITYVQPDHNGAVSPAAVEAALRHDTALVSVQLANNETGVLQPVGEIGRIARHHKVLFHCDAVQGVGQLPINVRELGIDMLSASAHKLYGPRGVGLLYIRQGLATLPLLAGGGQEQGRRAGTENIAAIRGFDIAAQLAVQDMAPRACRERELRCLLETGIGKATVLAIDAERLPAILSLLLPMSSEEMIARLDMQGIMVSGGAACASGSGEPSHVLAAMGLSPDEAKRVIRLSLGRYTTQQEIVAVIAAINTLLAQ